MLSSTAVAVIAITASTAPAIAQQQQPSSSMLISPVANAPLPEALRTVPPSTVPIFNRAAAMLHVAEERERNGPAAAREAYHLAAQNLRSTVAIGGISTAKVNAATGASLSAPLSLADVTADVHVLRYAVDDVTADQSKLMSRAASSYETGARYFLSATEHDPEWRVALNRTAPEVPMTTTAPGTAHAASNVLPATPRSVKVQIIGSRQDQIQARQQGMQTLQNLGAANAAANASAAAAAANGNATEGTNNATAANSVAYQQALAAQQAAILAYQRAAAQQAFLNAFAWGPWMSFGPNVNYNGLPIFTGSTGISTGIPFFNPSAPSNVIGPFGSQFIGPSPIYGGGGFFFP